MAETILIVDDEREIADLVELYLTNENYSVFKFYTAREALACIESTELDLAILDIMLPDGDGLSICRAIRDRHTYPIIMLTAKDEETDKITGLTLGADDYITKPFRPLELMARVKAQLRRYHKYGGGSKVGSAGNDGNNILSGSGNGDDSKIDGSGNERGNGSKTSGSANGDGAKIGGLGNGNGSDGRIGSSGNGNDDDGILTHAGLVININAHEVLHNEKPLALTPTEFSILRILCENDGNVVSSEKLFHEIWGDEYFSKSNNTITVHIRHLREKLGDTMDNPKYIKTVWGIGYKIGQ